MSDLTEPLLQQATETTGCQPEGGELVQSTMKEFSILQEVVRQCWIAGPMIGVNLLQYSITVLSVMFVGHLGAIELASASIATSLAASWATMSW